MSETLVWLLIEWDGTLLLGRRKADAPPFAAQWTLPGETLAQDELVVVAVARFGHEDLDVWVLGNERVETLRLRDGDDEYAVEVFRVGYEGTPRYRESGPFEEVGWAEPAALPEPMPAALSDWLRAASASEVKDR